MVVLTLKMTVCGQSYDQITAWVGGMSCKAFKIRRGQAATAARYGVLDLQNVSPSLVYDYLGSLRLGGPEPIF